MEANLISSSRTDIIGLGMGRTAKATDLKRYFPVDDKTVIINGNRTHGIRLGSKMK